MSNRAGVVGTEGQPVEVGIGDGGVNGEVVVVVMKPVWRRRMSYILVRLVADGRRAPAKLLAFHGKGLRILFLRYQRCLQLGPIDKVELGYGQRARDRTGRS